MIMTLLKSSAKSCDQQQLQRLPSQLLLLFRPQSLRIHNTSRDKAGYYRIRVFHFRRRILRAPLLHASLTFLLLLPLRWPNLRHFWMSMKVHPKIGGRGYRSNTTRGNVDRLIESMLLTIRKDYLIIDRGKFDVIAYSEWRSVTHSSRQIRGQT